jgi:prepilin-type N-terminal cleavage/methylation domain-containing protein
MIRREHGFTLIELIIVAGIMVLAIAAASEMFTGLLSQYKQQGKITETQIEGVVGLELFRQDIERAGYGLPWVIPSGTVYDEANQAPASTFNEAVVIGTTDPPRPMINGKNTGWKAAGSGAPAKSDYLVIKATNVTRDAASQKWSYLTDTVTKTWDVSSENFSAADYVIVLSPGSVATAMRTLARGGSSNPWSPQFSELVPAGFKPGSPMTPQPLFVYGIGATSPRMPFNRADYFIQDPTTAGAVPVPSRCAPNTGVLVKSVISQVNGSPLTEVLPLVDCAADLKVIFRSDTDNDGVIDGNTDGLTDPSGIALTAQQIRTQVKEVRVYVLAHEGQKDTTFTYPQATIQVGEFSLGHAYNLGTSRNYRWKVYTIVTSPKNMRQ